MIKSVGNLAKIKMKQLVEHSPAVVEPMLGIAPKAFNAVYMLFAFRLSSHFFDHYVVATHGKG